VGNALGISAINSTRRIQKTMSQIITLPTPKTAGLDAFDIFGTLRVGDVVLWINHIQSVERFECGTIEVRMASGDKHQFKEAEAEDFLKACQNLRETILCNMQQPQVVGVAPGTRIR